MSSVAHRPQRAVLFPLAPHLAHLALLAVLASGAARAEADKPLVDQLMGAGHWRLVVSPYSYHFRYSEEHRYVWAFGLEWQRSDDWLAGASYFSNSFGQRSAYLYAGKRWNQMFGQPQLFGQVSAGMLYGYRGKFEDKVPLNYRGYAPGALVSLGWQWDQDIAITGHLLGDAGVMLQLSYELR